MSKVKKEFTWNLMQSYRTVVIASSSLRAALKLYILSLSSVTNVLSPSCNREIQKSIS